MEEENKNDNKFSKEYMDDLDYIVKLIKIINGVWVSENDLNKWI